MTATSAIVIIPLFLTMAIAPMPCRFINAPIMDRFRSGHIVTLGSRNHVAAVARMQSRLIEPIDAILPMPDAPKSCWALLDRLAV
jgi:hypothetical protein